MNPDWNNPDDRKKYEEIWNKKDAERTEEENRFLIEMYHQEEFYAYGEL
jgi:hypothetical protein